MKNFIEEGEALTFTNTTGVAIVSGKVVPLGTAGIVGTTGGGRIGIATANIAIAAIGALSMKGVFELPLTAGQAPVVGDLAFWDGTGITLVAALNTKAGHVWALGPAGFVHVDINA